VAGNHIHGNNLRVFAVKADNRTTMFIIVLELLDVTPQEREGGEGAELV
jgi:hypothetical protein